MKEFSMSMFFRLIFAVFVAAPCFLNVAHAEDLSLLPKYGSRPKSDVQQAADERFVAEVDKLYKGNRKLAAVEFAAKGWESVRQGDTAGAMHRFNRSWLMDNSNGQALWGMAVVQAVTGRPAEAMGLFAEAEKTIGEDVDFATDYAKAIGVTGVSTKNEALVNDAFRRFASVYKRAPQHVANLQNWAITLFFVGNYAESWKKIQLAQAAPQASELDQRFIAALKSKLP